MGSPPWRLRALLLPVSLVRLLCSRQTDTPDQVCEPWVGAYGIEYRVDSQINQTPRMIVESLGQPVERLVLLAERDVDPGDGQRLHVGLSRPLLDVGERLLREGGIPGARLAPSQRGEFCGVAFRKIQRLL